MQKLHLSPVKGHPLFPSNPPLKKDSVPSFWNFDRRLKPPAERGGGGGGGAHYEIILGMPEHTHLKWLNKVVTFLDV